MVWLGTCWKQLHTIHLQIVHTEDSQQLGISPEQLSAQKQSREEELHYSKQSGGPRNVQGMILNVTVSPWVTRPCHTAN